MHRARLVALGGLLSLLLLGSNGFAEEPAEPAAESATAQAAESEATDHENLTTQEQMAVAEVAAEGTTYDPGHVAWMMVSTALVLMMTGPGLALFYGGLVRKKNILGVMMQCVFLMGMNSVLWVVIGYSLAFSTEGNPVIYTVPGEVTTDAEEAEPEKTYTLVGGIDKALLKGVGPQLDAEGNFMLPAAGTIPEELFMVFQMMFFIITPALIAGAFAERMKFSAMVLFTILWGLLIYCPLAHWVWSGDKAIFGGNSPFHALDFAGGLVVHASSGFSALVCALMLGKRLGYGHEPMPPHNLTYTVIGTCLLWVGWFGFNAGSALAADAMAVNAFVVTHLCAAAGVLGWAGFEWITHGKPSVLGACSGAVAGLVVITPASGFVTPGSAILMGLIGGVVCCIASTKVKIALGYDDALDAFGVHGVGGTLGAILTGVFVSSSVYPGVPEHCLRNQLISVAITLVFAVVGTAIILKLLDLTIGIRVSETDEVRGLDLSQHNEEGYIFQ